MKEALVSIITPVYNSAIYIDETINSVLKQNYQNWEWLIVDDLSTDNSVDIIKKYSNIDFRIKLIVSKTNEGSGPARNIAIKNAKGKYLAFLDSDDLWHKNKLLIQIKFMQERDSAFSYTSYNYIDENSNLINEIYHVSNRSIDYDFLLKKTDIGCLTAIYDVEKIGKMYMPNLRRKQDYALWLAILKKGFKADPLDKVLASYRVRKGSATSNKIILIRLHYSFLRKTQNLNCAMSFYYTVLWGMNGVNKFFLSKLKFNG
jgi:teichuronic acid biosynthesis glycosyltransferase TuaG